MTTDRGGLLGGVLVKERKNAERVEISGDVSVDFPFLDL